MAGHMKYVNLKPNARVPEILFLLDMVASSRKGPVAAGASEQDPLKGTETQQVYYDHRAFGPLVHFFVHASPFYRELLLRDPREGTETADE